MHGLLVKRARYLGLDDLTVFREGTQEVWVKELERRNERDSDKIQSLDKEVITLIKKVKEKPLVKGRIREGRGLGVRV